MRLTFVFVVLFLANAMAYGDDSVPMSSLASWKIIVDDQAIESEKYAAEEFKSLLKQSHGIDHIVRA